jgi:hypothetical protein
MVVAKRVIMVYHIGCNVVCYDCYIRLYGYEVIVIKYFWAYRLLFGSQQEICKGSNSLNCGFEN